MQWRDRRRHFDSFGAGYVNLDSGRLTQHLNGNDQSKCVFLADEHAFDPPEGTRINSHAIPILQEWMWLNLQGTLDHLANGINLLLWNARRMPGPSHDINQPGSTENLDLAV